MSAYRLTCVLFARLWLDRHSPARCSLFRSSEFDRFRQFREVKSFKTKSFYQFHSSRLSFNKQPSLRMLSLQCCQYLLWCWKEV